jgi:hypothetical protein
MDWIVQNILNLPPLLEGHRAQQKRVSSTGLNILRDMVHVISEAGRLGETLSTSDIAIEFEARGIEIPGKAKLSDDCYAGAKAIGKALGPLFEKVDMHELDEFWVHRSVTKEIGEKSRMREVKWYMVTRKGESPVWHKTSFVKDSASGNPVY